MDVARIELRASVKAYTISCVPQNRISAFYHAVSSLQLKNQYFSPVKVMHS
jgi:hypothetical protein